MQQQSFLGISALSFPRPSGASEDNTRPFWQALVQHFHRVRYIERGEPDAPRTVICVHGLLRNCRDMDFLARQLSYRWRVVCPDMPGRGSSDWLNEPSDDAGYNYPQYMLNATALVVRLGVDAVDWVGTSMGGLLGMMLAAQPNTFIRRLVMNDVGPFVPASVAEYISTYVSLNLDFDTTEEIEAYLRQIYAGFGNLTSTQWRHMARHSQRRKPNGRLGLAFDPNIGLPYKPPFNDVIMWPLWDAIRCPVLVLRGENSNVLLPEVAEEMTRRGPRASLRVIPGCGHAPALMSAEQIAIVEDWLENGEIDEPSTSSPSVAAGAATPELATEGLH